METLYLSTGRVFLFSKIMLVPDVMFHVECGLSSNAALMSFESGLVTLHSGDVNGCLEGKKSSQTSTLVLSFE